VCAFCWLQGAAEPQAEESAFTPAQFVFIGVLTGVVFIIITKRVLDKYEDVSFAELDGTNIEWAGCFFGRGP
jgi:hypothetical protein